MYAWNASSTAKLWPVGIEYAKRSDVDIGGSQAFWAAKRVFDITLGLLILPALALVALSLLLANPFFNRGPLFYSQIRMGRGGKPFRIFKFRSMLAAPRGAAAAFASAEGKRITPLGALMRKFRIDELPQIANVLIGDMSLVGPRPEQADFAQDFGKTIAGYRDRHIVRPGLSGLAQVTHGYADSSESTRLKLTKDLEYIHEAGWRMESRIVLRTLMVVATGFGAC